MKTSEILDLWDVEVGKNDMSDAGQQKVKELEVLLCQRPPFNRIIQEIEGLSFSLGQMQQMVKNHFHDGDGKSSVNL